jgi:AcrR family transcriptional regulator
MTADARRDQLLDAALQLVVRDGYSAASINAIARELDVTRPVVYNVFDGLDSLLHALLDRQEQRALSQLLSRIKAPPKPRGDLRAYVKATITDLISMVRDDPSTWSPILLAGADTPPAVRERIEADREAVRARFQVLVEPVLAAGLDGQVMSHALLGLAEYFGRLVLRDPDAAPAETIADTISTLLFADRSTRAAIGLES